jgi:hypothetical protein
VSRLLIAISLLAASCASGGIVRAVADAGTVRLNFDDTGKPIRVLGILISDKQARPGVHVCELRRHSPMADQVTWATSWRYGQVLGPNYFVVGCHPLEPGHTYAVLLLEIGDCTSYTTFKVGPDGSLEDLGPNNTSCLM